MSPGHPPRIARRGAADSLIAGSAARTVGGYVDSGDMTWIAPAVNRVPEPGLGGERESLERWLTYHRQTLLTKCAGLTAVQLATRAVPPSLLSLHGLVRHLSEVERSWFRHRFAGAELPDLYCTDDNIDGDFLDVDDADPAADLQVFVRECALADAAAAGRSLDDTFVHPGDGTDLNLRWIYLHMIEEYARHNGHADLLREGIDGATGD
jgi:hypothetical protein